MNKRLYISLDSLIDTRLGTLAVVDEEAYAFVEKHFDYWLRDYTDWPKLTGGRVTNEAFNERYAKRDDQVFCRSIMTGLAPVLVQLLTDYGLIMAQQLTSEEISVEVNLWPYEFDLPEIEQLDAALRPWFGKETVITFCSVPIDEMTPTWLVGRYDAAVMFEFHEWMRVHAQAFYSIHAGNFNIIAPKLFEKDPRALSVEEKQLELKRFKLVHLEFMDVEFINTQYFSRFRQ